MRHEFGDEARFVLPVVAENTFNAAVSLIYSAVTGAISAGSLAAASVGNQALNVISAFFALLTTGSAILTARLTGRGDEHNASLTVEQTMLLSPICSVAATVLLLLLSPLIMKLLMPGAEGEFFNEGSLYFKMLLLSVPFTVIMNAAAGILRAAGQSKSVLFGTVITNLVQIGALFLFTKVIKLEVVGVALATVICRAVDAVYLSFMLIKNHRGFHVNLRRALKPNMAVIKRIFSVGFPPSIDALAVQLGYAIINSMMVSLGGIEAQVVSVLNSVLLFTGICQGIGSAAATTLVGQLIGAGDIDAARRKLNRILIICELVSFALCVPALVLPNFSAGLFAKDETIRLASSAFMWIQLPYCFVAVGVNVCEPAVRVGGDVKYAMINISLCVLLIRLPLTYLLCVVLDKGVMGIYAANITSLGMRFLMDYLRIRSDKWGKREL